MEAEVKSELERLHDEDNRQNHRLDILEKNMEVTQNIAMSVQRLAINMESMLKEQEKQGERLNKLEAAPADNWNSMQRMIFNTIVGAMAGAIAVGLIYLMAQFI